MSREEKFQEYKMVHNFHFPDEPLKEWISYRNYKNIYRSDWYSLMAVIKKCWEKVNEFQYDTEQYEHITEEIFHPDYTLSEFMSADRGSLYERVVEFIKWYNLNKK